jgi:hypothetical protein
LVPRQWLRFSTTSRSAERRRLQLSRRTSIVASLHALFQLSW